MKSLRDTFLEPLAPLILDFRLIENSDNDLLRKWKNKNRQSFFYREIISSSEQRSWFIAYEVDPLSAMLIWTPDEGECGSIGLRRVANVIEVYNVMSWCEATRGTGKFLISVRGLLLLVSEYFPETSIQTSVLHQNQAVQWYQKLGFNKVELLTHESGQEFILMKFA